MGSDVVGAACEALGMTYDLAVGRWVTSGEQGRRPTLHRRPMRGAAVPTEGAEVLSLTPVAAVEQAAVPNLT